MKTLKSILIAAFLILSSFVFAQPGGGQKGGQQGPPPIPNVEQIETMVSELAEEISLSTEQEVEILTIYNNHIKIVKDKTSGNSKPRKEEMDALQTLLEKNVKVLLTDEQIDKYEAYNKKHKRQGPPK